MNNLVIFHPAGLGDFLLDITNLQQLIKSDLTPKRFTYVCHEMAKPLIQFFELDRVLDIYYLNYPTLKVKDISPFLHFRKKAKKVFVLGGMNLKRVGHLKKFFSGGIEFFGALQEFPAECIKNIKPNGDTYSFVEGPTNNTHRIIENFNLFKSQNLVEKDDFLIDEIISESGVSRLKSSYEYSITENYIILHTGLVEGKSYKSMSIDYWEKLLIELINNFDKKIVIIGSMQEKKNVDSILCLIQNKRILNYCGQTNLVETMGLIFKSELVLAVDGGMAHLAATLKKKLVVIFGPTNPRNVTPVGTDGFYIYNRIECSPCYFGKYYYQCPYGRKCLNEIDLNLIIDAVKAALKQIDIQNSHLGDLVVNKIPTLKKLESHL